MLGPVIRTPLLDRMSIQLQFTFGNTGMCSGLPLLWNQREKWLLFQKRSERQQGEYREKSKYFSNCTTFHIRGALSWHFVCYNVLVMHEGIFSSCLILSDLHMSLYLFVFFVLNKPFSDSLFCLADDKATYMIVNYCPINNR